MMRRVVLHVMRVKKSKRVTLRRMRVRVIA